MKSPLAALTLVLLNFPLLTSAQASRVIENPLGHFSISIPDNWTLKTDSSTTDLYPPDEGVMDSWKEFLGVSVADANETSLEEAFNYYTTQDFPSYYPDFSIVKKGEENINGLRSKWVLYSFSNSGSSNQTEKSATLYNIFYLMLKGGSLYSLNGITEKGFYPKYEKEFLTIIRSFQVIP